jgi:hypothetical protein
MAITLRSAYVLCAAFAILTSCASTPTENPLLTKPQSASGTESATVNPELVAVNAHTGALEFWPIQPHGGRDPQPLSGKLGVSSSTGMVANGHVVAMTSAYPPSVVVYNVKTANQKTLADPFGTPIDIAIDKNGALYVVNVASPVGNVTMYPAGSMQPTELDCKWIDLGEGVAVDNEGDIFVDGYGPGHFMGVVEIPNGPHGPEPNNCMRLHLKTEKGYLGGITVDPKTDDLVVLSDPDLCAGGIEGRMTIYPKPYDRSTARSHDLNANCAGGIRLNADSTIVFVGDQDVSGSFSFILQRSFPDGRDMGIYHGGAPNAMTTIPNTLPN